MDESLLPEFVRGVRRSYDGETFSLTPGSFTFFFKEEFLGFAFGFALQYFLSHLAVRLARM